MKSDIKRQVKSSAKGLYDFADRIEFKVAMTRTELLRASSLVFRQYLKSGYVVREGTSLHFGIKDIYPNKKTIITIYDDIIFGTVTIIPDSFIGLPMDSLYETELASLRKKGYKLCEISMLACESSRLEPRKRGLSNFQSKYLVYYLFKYIFEYTKNKLGMDYLCITINPSQRQIYETLFFEDLGPIKPYYNLDGAPALGKIFNINAIEDNLKKARKKIVHRIVFESVLKKQPKMRPLT